MTLNKSHLRSGETIPKFWAEVAEFCGEPLLSPSFPSAMAMDEEGRLVMLSLFQDWQDGQDFASARKWLETCSK